MAVAHDTVSFNKSKVKWIEDACVNLGIGLQPLSSLYHAQEESFIASYFSFICRLVFHTPSCKNIILFLCFNPIADIFIKHNISFLVII